MAQRRGSRSSRVTLFFGLHIYLARRFCENLQSARGPTQRKPGSVNNKVSKRNYPLHHFSITIYLHPATFMRQYTFEKKLAIEEMLIEQITEFELRDPGLPVLLKLIMFMTIQKSLTKIFD